MRLEGKKVLVVGTGISGIAATELLVGQKIDTVLFDGNKELDATFAGRNLRGRNGSV